MPVGANKADEDVTQTGCDAGSAGRVRRPTRRCGVPLADVTNLAKVAYTIRAGKVIYQKP